MIRPADELGPILTGRSVATQLREQIERAAQDGGDIVVDLDGVDAISPSFADELFAKLDPQLVNSGRIRFEHLDEDFEFLAKFVRAGRPNG